VFAFPDRFQTNVEALPVLAMVIVPALLMVSTIRYRSFKTFEQSRRSYPVLFLIALGLVLLASRPEEVLLTAAYTYLASAFIGLAWQRMRRRPPDNLNSTDVAPQDTKAI
jgi:CDP-diacylglycerol--serine O-phosphatidyltransferase